MQAFANLKARIEAGTAVEADRDTTAQQAGAAFAREHVVALRRVVSNRDGVGLPLRLWDGSEEGAGPFQLVLKHPWSLRAMLVPMTDLNAGEAYLRDDIDIEGDMVEALHAIANLWQQMTLRDRLQAGYHLLRLPSPPAGLPSAGGVGTLLGRSHSRQRDEAAVRFHYDIGNDFFREYLDDDLVYSCAYFDDPQMSLEMAQHRKLDTVARKLALRPGLRVLDIGCGWGSFVIHAARNFGVEGVGVTLSRQQASLARARVEAAGLQDRVEIRLADYREVTDRFDAICSIGMAEHVGSEKLPIYFAHLAELLIDGGRLLNHNITTGRRMAVRDLGPKARESFVAHYVFPDGSLSPAWHTVRHFEQCGLELIDVQQLRRHYALTLREWIRRLETNHDEAVAAASEEAYRTWRAYMSASVVGFETNDLGVVQVLGVKGRDTLALDRSYMTPDPEPPSSRDCSR